YVDRDRWLGFHQRLLERVASLPGVSAAALNSGVPLDGFGSESSIRVEGRPAPAPGDRGTRCLFQSGTPDYFRALGIALVKGRFFPSTRARGASRGPSVDGPSAPQPFPEGDPTAKRAAFGPRAPPAPPGPVRREIAGVAPPFPPYGIAWGPPFAQIYTP